MKRPILTCLLIVTMAAFSILSLSSSAEKNYYRWLDERGRPVHSDRPPPKGIDYEVVSTGSTLTRPVEAEEGAVPAEIEPTAGNEFEQADSEKNQRVKKNPEYCQRAKDNLATLSRAARVRIRNDQGEYHYLDAEEKEAQRQDAEAGISTYCE